MKNIQAKENTHMNEIEASIKRKTKAEPKLMQYIDIHTSYPYTNVSAKKRNNSCTCYRSRDIFY